MKRICVFCGSNSGTREDYGTAAHALTRLLARRGMGLVYGGGNIGLMGELADSMLQAGGEVIGVIPRALMEKEVGHQGLTALHIVETMHQRKALMNEFSDAFIALPGGFGTLDEFFEILTWSQLGIHGKPCGLLNVAGYYDSLLAMLDHAVAEKFLRPTHRGLVIAEADVDALLRRLAEFMPPTTGKWTDARRNFL
jgi:uncharacterized protein (TIGR00730 family)